MLPSLCLGYVWVSPVSERFKEKGPCFFHYSGSSRELGFYLSPSDWGLPEGSVCFLRYSTRQEEKLVVEALGEGLLTQPAGSKLLHGDDKPRPAPPRFLPQS